MAGIATALVIVFSQLFYFQAANYCQKKAEAEQHDQKTGHESYISIPSSTISSTSHLEIHQDLSFVLGILFELKSEKEESTEVVLPVDRFFQTLFRFIISPNAP
jgi:hypothetical protein